MSRPSASNWLDTIASSAALDAVTAQLSRSQRVVVSGSQGSSTYLLAGLLAQKLNCRVLLVVAHLDEADDVVNDLPLVVQRSAGQPMSVSRFGALEVLPGESNVSLELLAERLNVVSHLMESKNKPSSASVLVAPIQALMQSVPDPATIHQLSLTISVNQELSPGQLMNWLTSAGYQRTDAIEHPGDFAARGGIIDIYPPAGSIETQGSDNLVASDTGEAGTPIRIDYFGDEIDSISRIDPDTMGSGARLQRVRILGAAADKLQSDRDMTNLLSLLGDDTLVMMHEVMELSEQARGYFERLTNPRGIYAPNAVFKAITQRRHIEVNQYSARGSDTAPLPLRPLESFDRDATKAVEQLGELAADANNDVVVLCAKEVEKERLEQLIEQHAPDAVGKLAIEVGFLHRGFIWEHGQKLLHVIPHQELFHRYDAPRRIRRVSVGSAAGGRAADAFLEISPGDYVVHQDHGIARFVGLKTMKEAGKKGKGAAGEEYLTLEFAQKALLHVPASQIDLVQKYIGGFNGRPPLSLLGGKRWEKQKEQVAESVKDLAAELLRVQAARSSMAGVRYPEDTPWQKAFEAEFPYQETEDQLAAINAVKKDMADHQPMDRLICGDVGFGKTEIAIRAAFKAAEFGKQVAVLVPTTILAEQHERSFRARMAGYPIKIESLSRFKTPKQIREVLKKMSLGQVDILVGTHRLLSKDVVFRDLGLVIIDEEQRFGVEHKNKLLELRVTTDVLTLSATPIPRTLHMAMLGLRNISSLSTPPMDRRAIVTEVMPFDRRRIQQALVRELNRQGQVYFLHNRVHDIQSVADDIQQLVPDARVIVGHGQMPGHELEKVMLKFVRKQADILVATTIIESGLDIPSANTIFINQADHFGLAELHQLRGRVGRSRHRAYCYLLLPEDRPITDKASQRLRAIEQYAMLGSGFKIAMRDLEIRGAGNLLGPEQSGHIAAVGYDMYCHLLEEATRKLKNERIIEPVRTHLELGLTGALPKAYISSDKFRMEAYRRLSRASTLEELAGVIKDMTDAYGKPPEAAQTLIDLTEIRIAASTLEVDGLKLDGPDLIFRTQKPQKLDHVLRDAPGRASIIDNQTVYYRPPANYLSQPSTLLAVLRKLLVRPVQQLASTSGN
jgi:transcription-repair coupling factor (superfamily II helicase)